MYSYGPPTHGRAKAGRPARTYIQQLCEHAGCCPEDLPEALNEREMWRERVRDIRATSVMMMNISSSSCRARISLTLSRHFSLSFIASGRSSGQHPACSHSCWMYVRAGRPAFARPCVGVHHRYWAPPEYRAFGFTINPTCELVTNIYWYNIYTYICKLNRKERYNRRQITNISENKTWITAR